MISVIIKRIISHPISSHHALMAMTRFLYWQLYSRLIKPNTVVPFGERSKMILHKGLTVASGNYYMGLFEFEEMAFVLHALREKDVFIDIGANIGTFTLLAASERGVKTVAAEPLPETFKHLQANIKLNDVESLVDAYNIGLGADSGLLKFTNNRGAVNHVATEGEMNTLDVQVLKYDDWIKEEGLKIVKIDVEGFETEVIKGMQSSLIRNDILALLVETNESGQRYGNEDFDIHNSMLEHGYKPYQYLPFERAFEQIDLTGQVDLNNTIYTKHPELVAKRVKEAKKVAIYGVEF